MTITTKLPYDQHTARTPCTLFNSTCIVDNECFLTYETKRQTRVESSALAMWFASKEADYQQEQMHCHNPESDSSALTAGTKVASQLRN